MSEEEIANKSSGSDCNEDVTVVHHNSQHKSVIQDIVEEKEENFLESADNFTQNGFREKRFCGLR